MADGRLTASFSRWRLELCIRIEAARQSDGNGCWALHQQESLAETELLACCGVAPPAD
jgi:hypothetical protein